MSNVRVRCNWCGSEQRKSAKIRNTNIMLNSSKYNNDSVPQWFNNTEQSSLKQKRKSVKSTLKPLDLKAHSCCIGGLQDIAYVRAALSRPSRNIASYPLLPEDTATWFSGRLRAKQTFPASRAATHLLSSSSPQLTSNYLLALTTAADDGAADVMTSAGGGVVTPRMRAHNNNNINK